MLEMSKQFHGPLKMGRKKKKKRNVNTFFIFFSAWVGESRCVLVFLLIILSCTIFGRVEVSK